MTPLEKPSMVHARELEVVTSAMRAASRLLLAEAVRPGGPRGSNCTADIDLEIGALLLRQIRQQFPDDAVLCEETGRHPGESGRCFIIDPHDGTADFLKGSRETSISVALIEGGQFLLASVVAPFSTDLTGHEGLTVSWASGRPFQLNGKNLSPPPAADKLTTETVVLISRNLSTELLEANMRLLSPARVVECSSVATRFALVAAGKADVALTVNKRLSPWDFAGGQALLQAVGGSLVSPEGNRIMWSGTRVELPPEAGFFGARSAALASHVASLFQDMVRR